MSLPPPPPPTDSATCYRHADRETGRRCTRCGKPACGDCLVAASVGSHCLDCAKAARPDMRTRARFWSARQPAMVTMAIIAANVIVFLYVTVRDPQSLSGRLTIGHAQLGLSDATLGSGGGFRLPDGSVYITDGNDWYRLITSGFLHYGLVHLAFNMYLLYVLGQMLEPSIGRVRFLLVYLAGLLGGSAGSLLIDAGALAGGASGAVFGLMALAFVGYYLHGTNPMQTSIGTLLMLNLVITFIFPNISIGGHLGGAAAGALAALVVMAPRHRAYPVWATYVTPLGIALLSVVISVISVR